MSNFKVGYSGLPLKKNNLTKLKITGITSEGSGVGKTESGFTVFVNSTAPGDVITAKIIKPGKTYAIGIVEEFAEKSPARINPDCEHFAQCGGCAYRHINYGEELRIKQQQVEDALQRIGGIDTKTELKMNKIVGADGNTNAYRNKVQLPFGTNQQGKVITGYYAYHSHRVVDCCNCLLNPPIFNEIAEFARDFANTHSLRVYDENTRKGLLRHLYIRQGYKTDQIMVCLVLNAGGFRQESEFAAELTASFAQVSSVAINTNRENTNVILGRQNRILFGKEHIATQLFGLEFSLSPLSFFQVNPQQTEKLYAIAQEFAALTKDDILLDLYCGIGSIGLTLAAQCKKVIGVEIIPSAVKNATANAQHNNITNAEFICADASSAAASFAKSGLLPNVVIIDPPRKGCTPEVLAAIVQMHPKKIVYVSCNPSTLARDLKILAQSGYTAVAATPVDMFPRTAHVETVVLLSKLKSAQSIEVEIELDDMDLTTSESKAIYAEIKQYVLDKTGLKVSQLYIGQVKRKHGIIERINYNLGEGKAKIPQVPPEKEKAIEDALKHFKMI
ncbi:MAG: 23S rRNA (uracil(1939)-C(5))-methyltransferase RlmD [Oscillospiraceae bacterium]|jgi:23S rRNA (uracil1939-C5)-methyltransferase|nr:23S rRNA (uracil(1939)-C(5))-methyltransferase RlmD [Oscillospiraceae bacterium]